MKAEIEVGARVGVGDERRDGEEKIIARGTVEKISEQEDAVFAYLNTGFYICIIPPLKETR